MPELVHQDSGLRMSRSDDYVDTYMMYMFKAVEVHHPLSFCEHGPPPGGGRRGGEEGGSKFD